MPGAKRPDGPSEDWTKLTGLIESEKTMACTWREVRCRDMIAKDFARGRLRYGRDEDRGRDRRIHSRYDTRELGNRRPS